MRNKTRYVIAVLGLLGAASGAVGAPATVGELDDILSQTIVMQARARLAAAQASAAPAGAGAMTATPGIAPLSQANADSAQALPGVVSIYGVQGKLAARLAYSPDMAIDVQVGTVLPSGEKVVAIDHDTVTVMKNKKRTPLGLYAGQLDVTQVGGAH